MTDKQMMKMLSDLVQEIDYDIWKEMFVKDCMEDPELAEKNKADLVKIVKRYL